MFKDIFVTEPLAIYIYIYILREREREIDYPSFLGKIM